MEKKTSKENNKVRVILKLFFEDTVFIDYNVKGNYGKKPLFNLKFVGILKGNTIFL